MAKKHPEHIAIGKAKGHNTTKIKSKNNRSATTKKKKVGKRTQLIRQVIGQVSGFSGYEKRIN
jgi:hypothetical protein